MEKETGGAAFPLPHGAETIAGAEGMTLRDYFAAKAMQGIVSDPDLAMGNLQIAEWAYKQADAMLEARK